MPYTIVLYFNETTEIFIQTLWSNIADKADIPDITNSGIRPHLTLAIYDELNCQPCEIELEKFAQQASRLDIQAAHIGVFYQPDIILFLAPTPTEALLDLQEEIHNDMADKASNPWEMYRPGKWIPHCTLAMDMDVKQLEKAVSFCAGIQLPVKLEAARIGAVEFLPISNFSKHNLKV